MQFNFRPLSYICVIASMIMTRVLNIEGISILYIQILLYFLLFINIVSRLIGTLDFDWNFKILN